MPLGKEAWKHDPQIMAMERRRQEIAEMPDGPEKDKAQKAWNLALHVNLWACGVGLLLVVIVFIACIGALIFNYIKA